MRISEIIKKSGLRRVTPEVTESPSGVVKSQPSIPEEPITWPAKRISPKDEKSRGDPVSLREETKPELINQQDSLFAEQIYGEAINFIKKILDSLAKEKPILDFKLVSQTVKKIVAKVLSADTKIISLVNKSTPDNYLYAHLVNVCILTVKLASRLGWSEDKINSLGICALLHDVGMVRVFSLANGADKLTPQEYEEVRKHPIYGKEILEKLNNGIEKNAKELLALIAYQEHERIDGQGYPRGLKDKDMHEFTKIIGLVDVYEGLTHPRSYRERMLPHQAVRYLIETCNEKFESLLLKIFIEELSLYPLGSFVKLNTEEIGEVVKSNPKFPTRPVLKMILGTQGERLDPSKYINLTETPILHIRESVDETKLKINDKELMLKLKVKRWWISSES